MADQISNTGNRRFFLRQMAGGALALVAAPAVTFAAQPAPGAPKSPNAKKTRPPPRLKKRRPKPRRSPPPIGV